MKKELSSIQQTAFFEILKLRFEKNIKRHINLDWKNIQLVLEKNPSKLWSLYQMEQTGGEPDVVLFDNDTNEYIFMDCAAESPKDRRSLCYDKKALEARKEHKPKNNVIDLITEMDIELLSEKEYRYLQQLENFDTKTSSWIKTPPEIRKLGGALFADFRYNTVFVYHNGASSYYAARGFRGMLRVE